MIDAILSSGIELSVGSNGKLLFNGKAQTVTHLKHAMKQWKPELISILRGESVSDVGKCDQCGTDLIGLPVSHDGYTNRVCGACGTWHSCLPPQEPVDTQKPSKNAGKQSLFIAAAVDYGYGLSHG